MPIHGPSSYPATMSLFIQHWEDLNTTLGAPLILAGGRALSLLDGWLTDVQTKIAQTSAGVISAVLRKGELDVLKASLISWTVIFNARLRADFASFSYVKNLLPAPQISAGRGLFVEPLVKTQQIWADAEVAIGAPVVLTRRTTRLDGSLFTETLTSAEYMTLITEMEAQWNEWTRAQQVADNIREQRNDVMALAYAAMRDYRLKVPLELPAGHALVDSLPALSPESTSPPDAPEAAGAWDAGTQQAVLTAVPSTSAEVTTTDCRYCPDEPYDANNEVILASIPAGQPLTFSTDIGLAVPGDTARFTWVAVTPDGREGRSGVVAVTRP